jgi:hypothetical protein
MIPCPDCERLKLKIKLRRDYPGNRVLPGLYDLELELREHMKRHGLWWQKMPKVTPSKVTLN